MDEEEDGKVNILEAGCTFDYSLRRNLFDKKSAVSVTDPDNCTAGLQVLVCGSFGPVHGLVVRGQQMVGSKKRAKQTHEILFILCYYWQLFCIAVLYAAFSVHEW